LLDGTVPSTKFLLDGLVPSTKFLLDGTVPSTKILLDGTVPATNHYQKGMSHPDTVLVLNNVLSFDIIIYIVISSTIEVVNILFV
jgi:hypothetical protein